MTPFQEGIPREHLGIVVSYKVKVKLLMNGFGGDVRYVTYELFLFLTHLLF